MRNLIALSLLFVSSTALSQALTYSPQDNIHWIDGQTVRITYSPVGAPTAVPPSLMAQTLANVEARLNGLGLPGLNVQIGSRDIATGCNYRAPNTVHICWELRDGRRADSINTPMTDGVNFWREGVMILGNQADWTDATRPIYQQVQHYLLHVLGFGHPLREGPPSVINNNAMDLTEMDIDGLRAMYKSGRCRVTYEADGSVLLPFVKYSGNAYAARIQHTGGNSFSVNPGSIRMFHSGDMPTSPCQGLVLDASNELHIPEVWFDGQLYWATLRYENDGFTVIDSGAK